MELGYEGLTTRRDCQFTLIPPQTVSCWKNCGDEPRCYEPRVILPYEPSVEYQSPYGRYGVCHVDRRRPEFVSNINNKPIVEPIVMKGETLANSHWKVISDDKVREEMKLWQMKVKVLGFTPEEIRLQLDPTYRVIKVIAKRPINNSIITPLPRQSNNVNQHIFERVFSLPENIDFTKLMSVFIPTEGILHFKAPLLKMKYKNIENEQVDDADDADDADVAEYESELKYHHYFDKLPVYEYLRVLKKLLTFSPHAATASDVDADVHIECEKEGKQLAAGEWKILIQFNTLLDKATCDNMKVLFNQKERRLQIIAKHQLNELFGKNIFHREFSLPKYLDVEQLKWRVMDNGVLQMEIPCRQTPMEGKYLHNIPLTYYA